MTPEQNLTTPQAPEDVRDVIYREITAARDGHLTVAEAVAAISRAHLLSTPVTVTMEECQRLRDAWLVEPDGTWRGMAIILRRVLGDRIQIAGEPS